MVLQAPQLSLGFAVAGGRSRRMGSDKALLAWANTTLLDHAVARLSAVSAEVRILSGTEPRYAGFGLRQVLDELPEGGPLAGIAAGLAAATGQQPALFLAVDLPLVPVALLQELAELGRDFDAVVPVTREGPHPLCAAYAPACLQSVRARLAAGERRMTCFWPDVRVRQLGEAELGRFGDPALLLRNLNTPEDYKASQR